MADTDTRSQNLMEAADGESPTSVVTLARPLGRFLPNLIGNLAGFLVNIAIGLFFTPFLITRLGVANYGLFPLTMNLMLYMGIVAMGLNCAVGRFLTIAVERGDATTANRIFNTSLLSNLSIAVAFSIPAFWLSKHVELLMRVPSGSETDAIQLLRYAMCVFFIATITTPFEVASFCRNRFDFRNAVSISGTAVRIVLTVLLITTGVPALRHIGIGLLAGSLVSLAGAIWVWRVLLPGLRIRLSSFSMDTLKDLSSMGGWSVLNQAGVMLYLTASLLVVNRMLGPEAGGQFAAVQQWSLLLRGLAVALGGVFAPSLTAFFGRGDIDGLVAYCRQSTKFIGLAMTVPVGVISGFSKPLLGLWLGPDFQHLAALMTLMTITLSSTLVATALFHVQIGANRIKVPGIVTCVLGLAGVALAVLFAGPLSWGLYGVAIAGALTLVAKDLVFTPLHASHILGRRSSVFLSDIVPIVAVTVAFAALCYAASLCLGYWTWARLIFVASAMAAVFFLAAFRLMLTREDREKAIELWNSATLPFRHRDKIAD